MGARQNKVLQSKLGRRRCEGFSEFQLLEGIAEENSGTEEDGGDQIKRKKRVRVVWNELPSDEFEGVLENYCCNSEKKTDSCARRIAA